MSMNRSLVICYSDDLLEVLDVMGVALRVVLRSYDTPYLWSR